MRNGYEFVKRDAVVDVSMKLHSTQQYLRNLTLKNEAE